MRSDPRPLALVPHKFFTMPMVPKDNGYHIHHQRMPFYCVPCILFSDAALRGQHLQPNQGIALLWLVFMCGKCNMVRCSNTKLVPHIVAQATFLLQRMIEHSLNQQAEVELTRRKAEVVSNRTILKCIVDAVMFLGHQGLPMRGHKESLTEYSDNLGNFLELLKVISNYNIPLQQHLENVKEQQIERKVSGMWLPFSGNTRKNAFIWLIRSILNNVLLLWCA